MQLELSTIRNQHKHCHTCAFSPESVYSVTCVRETDYYAFKLEVHVLSIQMSLIINFCCYKNS